MQVPRLHTTNDPVSTASRGACARGPNNRGVRGSIQGPRWCAPNRHRAAGVANSDPASDPLGRSGTEVSASHDLVLHAPRESRCADELRAESRTLFSACRNPWWKAAFGVLKKEDLGGATGHHKPPHFTRFWRLEGHPPVRLAVGLSGKAPLTAEMEIRVLGVADRPPAVMLLEGGYRLVLLLLGHDTSFLHAHGARQDCLLRVGSYT